MSRARTLGLALTLASAPTAADAALEPGVIGVLPFLDGAPEPGALYDGHIRLELSPNPKLRPFPMLLDTGASHTVMSPRWARALGVNVRRTRDDYYRRQTLLGRPLLFRVDTSWSDTMHVSAFEFGVIGGDFLRDYVIEVDYRAGHVRFLDPEIHGVYPERAEPGELVLPMGLTDGRPTLRIGLGQGSLDFLIDTGAPGSLLISEEKAAELGIEIPADARTIRGLNVIGSDTDASFYVPSVRIGPRRERHVVLGVVQREGSTYRVTNLAGRDDALLGNRFLSRFRVRFDYVHQTLGLLPQLEPPAPESVLAYVPENSPELQPVYVPLDLSPAREALRFEQEVWIDLESPADGAELEQTVAYYEVRGWAGAGQELEHDVMVVIDTSGSTAIASGSDIDGDGKVGKRSKRRREAWRNFNPAYLSNDAGDTILAAELLATRRLVERMGPGRTRIGVLSFSSECRVEAALGSDEAGLERALDALDKGFGSGITNMARAIRTATEALVLARAPGQERRQSILVLSDGYPTAPEGRAVAAAYEAAAEASALGIRIYSFALGLGELQDDDVFVEIALMSGGGHVRLDQPGEIVHELSLVNLTEVTDIAITNLTLGEPARATRVFPDGSFDGLVPLQPGENRIRVTARGDAGGEAVEERRVIFRPEQADPAALGAFKEKLRARTIELELGRRARRSAPPRQVEIAPEDPD